MAALQMNLKFQNVSVNRCSFFSFVFEIEGMVSKLHQQNTNKQTNHDRVNIMEFFPICQQQVCMGLFALRSFFFCCVVIRWLNQTIFPSCIHIKTHYGQQQQQQKNQQLKLLSTFQFFQF